MAQEKCVSPQALLFFPESEGAVRAGAADMTFIYFSFFFKKYFF